MDSLELKLCDIQGRLFELSVTEGYDSEKFVPFFMNSNVAKSLDSNTIVCSGLARSIF